MKTMPRGIRNCNPGNIVRSNIPWKGLRPVQTDPEFCQFIDHHHGLRAMAMNLRSSYYRHGNKTTRKIIQRWSRTDQETYAASVARAIGVSPDEVIRLSTKPDYAAIMAAMIRVECAGYRYPDAEVWAAIDDAEVVK